MNKLTNHLIVNNKQYVTYLLVLTMLIILSSACNSKGISTSNTITLSIPETIYPFLSNKTPTLFSPTSIFTPTSINTATLTMTSTIEPNNWANLGPDGGGIFALAIDPKTPSILFTSTSTGFYKSENSGENWENKGHFWSTDIIIDPISSSTIYAKTAGYISKSTDGGNSWNSIENTKSLNISGGLAIDPFTPSTLYIPSGSGINKSNNGGKDWIFLHVGDAVFTQIIFDPIMPNILYVGGKGGIIYKSIDGGNNWSPLKTIPVKSTSADLIKIAIDPITPTILYAAIRRNGIYKSTNGGQNWRSINTGFTNYYDISSLVIDASNPIILYAGTFWGIYKSSNGGATWQALDTSKIHKEIQSLVIDPVTTNILYAGTTVDGVVKSTNAGKDWFARNNGISNDRRVTSMAIGKSPSNTIYAGVDTRGVFKSSDGGKSWTNILPIDSQFHTIAIDPTKLSTIFVGINGGVVKSTNDGKYYAPTNLWDAMIYCLAFDPFMPNTLYAGINDDRYNFDGALFKSTNGGESWILLKNGLPNISVVFDIVFDPTTPGTQYVGTLYGVYKSTNGGDNWGSASILPMNNRIESLAIDPITTTTLYAGTFDDGILKSNDGGINWFSINNGIKEIGWISDIVIDPTNPSIVYLCVRSNSSESSIYGVYKSIDSGESWLNIGLINFEVFALGIDPITPTTIYAATENGFFSLTQSN